MNLLIVYAHPSPTSFNARLKDAAVAEIRSLGHSVQVTDLYADGFTAAGGPDDFLVRHDSEAFHYQAEQQAAAVSGSFQPEIAREQQKLHWADGLILQFPLWWGGPPAILKGWLDRVCAYGVAYVDGARFASGLFRGRRALLSVTTGGTPRRFSEEGEYGAIEKVLWPIQHLALGYLGYDLQTPQVSYAVARVTDREREDMVQALRNQIRSMLVPPFETTPIPSASALLARNGERNWKSAV